MNPTTQLPVSLPAAPSLRLYFAPMACSLASRIVCYEAGLTVDFVEVDTAGKRLVGGGDFLAVNPMGQVPVLEFDDDVRLTENAAVLQYLGALAGDGDLAPADGFARARLHQWRGFIGTELHKALFVPLLGKTVDAATRDEARARVALRMAYVETHLADHAFLGADFTVADAYLVTVLNWAAVTGIDLAAWPAVQAYHRRQLERPSVARAVAEEFALYRAGQTRAA